MSQPDWVIEMVNRLEPDEREEYEERVAIMHIDGKLSIEHAECLALLCILRNHPLTRKERDLI